jgi:SAM-dependent methyltransferase/uncharacterized protein YbaR (Trm112 family)
LKILHYETLRPLCPSCLRERKSTEALFVAAAFREGPGTIEEGILACPHPGCRAEYPIVDGIPILVADLSTFLGQSHGLLMARTDLSPEIESLIGDLAGPGSAFDLPRQHLSTYVADHWGDLDPEPETNPDVSPGSVVRLLETGLSLIPGLPEGPVLDLGCSVGRTTLALAGTYDRLTLGLDLNLAMLRFSADLIREARVRYPRRRVGLVYERRDFPVRLPHLDQVDFWAADASDPPLASDWFSLAVSLNLVDCIGSPPDHLRALARLVKPDGRALVAAPYDWSGVATSPTLWLGGHSRKAGHGGDSAGALRRFLTDQTDGLGLELVDEKIGLPWSVRLHDRAVVRYRVHLAALRKNAVQPLAGP